MRPRVYSSPKELARGLVTNQIQVLETTMRYLEQFKLVLDEEETMVHDFPTMRAGYANIIQKFQDNLIHLRRQKALQKELDERIERLTLLRETRMRHQKAEKEEKDKAANEKEAKEMKAQSERIKISTQVYNDHWHPI